MWMVSYQGVELEGHGLKPLNAAENPAGDRQVCTILSPVDATTGRSLNVMTVCEPLS